MIRKILTGFIIVVVLLVAGLVIFIKTVDLNQYLPQLTQQISQALGRQVGVQKVALNISLNQGVVIDVSGISLTDDVQFSKEPFLFIRHIHGGVSLVPLLTKRQIEITSVEILAPQIILIKNKQGVFNYESMIVEKKPEAGSGGTSSGESAPSTPPKALPKLLVNSFVIQDAKIVYQDNEAAPAINVSVDDIDAKVINFSLTDPFTISLDASLFANGQNLHVDGTSRIELNLQQARLDDVHFTFDLARLDVDRINKEIAAVAPLGLQKGLSGGIKAVISQMVVGSKGLLVLSLDGAVEGVHVPLKMLATPIDQLTAKMDVTESKVKISDFSFKLNSGLISGQASIKDYLTAQNFDVSMTMDHLLLEEIIDQSKAPAKIKGGLSGSFEMAGQGFTPEALNQIKGRTEVTLSDAELVNVNIVKSVLEKIPVLSALSEVVGASSFSQELQNKIGGESTKIAQAKVKARIEESKILIDDIQMAAEKFTLASHGQVGFDQEVDLQAELKFTKEMSASLIESTEDMKALLDENKEIHFPVKITGKLPNLSYMPDLAYISKLLIVNKGSGELQKVLDKNPEAKKLLDIFTGGDKSSAQEQDASQAESGTDSSSDENAEPNQGKKLLQGLFKGAFK